MIFSFEGSEVFLKKHELLVPVGNYESLIAAINSGADAVYLGGKKFGARAFADNFTDEVMLDAIKLCHLYGVKIYVTINTLIHEDEFDEALNYIDFLHRAGVDALIMQDVGLIHVAHEMFPNLEIHASTQMHNHSEESLAFLEKLGVKRVVFAREMPFDYLNSIDTKLEKEVFIHGSLCICYSGQCLFSSLVLNRSGNRGMCAGLCRLPYSILENGKNINTEGNYLLSPKDLCSFNDFKKLMDSNIVSFKIEGRMKSAQYVSVVTRIYKKLMNQYENGEEMRINDEDYELLQSIFNREYTKGYLFEDNPNLINNLAPNHLGIKIGKVINITDKKIKIKLTKDIHQFCSIRFKESNKGINLNFIYDEKDNLVNSAKAGDIIYLDNFFDLKKLDEVFLTMPVMKLDKEVTKKIPVSVELYARIGEKLSIKISDGINETHIEGQTIEKAKNAPITKERIIEAIAKMGNTPFKLDNIIINMDDDIFICVSNLNTLRRSALESLGAIRENKKTAYQKNAYHKKVVDHKKHSNCINILARTKEQIKACKTLGIKNIIVEDKSLLEEGFIYKVPRDKMHHDYAYENLLVTDYASLDKYKNMPADSSLNVFNHHAFNYLKEYAQSIMLSNELSIDDIAKIMQHYENNVNAEVLVYGREELMIMKHCLLKDNISKQKICNCCQNGRKYELEDRNKEKYPILNNYETHSTVILNYKVRNLVNDMPLLKKAGINNFRIELYDETYEQTIELVKNFTCYI